MSAALPHCPYIGLQPYTEQDRDYFFGREEERDTIAANLANAPLTLLYGASGVGKSSVLEAGVVPTLRDLPDGLVVTWRRWQDPEFLDLLKARVLTVAKDKPGYPAAIDPKLPFDELLLQVSAATHRTLLIILDQFEEYFLYHPETDSDNHFDEELARAINRVDIAANFLLAIREDGLSRLDRFRRRIPNLMTNMLRLDRLSYAGAQLALLKPLEVYNARRSGLPQFSIEEALTAPLLEDVQAGRVLIAQIGQGTVSGSGLPPEQREGRIEAPFLQMILTRLWNEEVGSGPTPASYTLRLATYQRLGKADTIVKSYLDDLMNHLNAEEQEISSLFFDRLVTPSGTKIIQTSDDLVKYAKRDAAEVLPTLKLLDDKRVLRRVAPPLDQPNTMRYELFHDVLAPAVLAWLQGYREKQAQEQARKEEQQRQEKEQQRQAEMRRQTELASTRRANRIIATLSVLLLLVAIVAVVVAIQNVELAARAHSRELGAIALNLVHTADNPDRGLLVALEAVQSVYITYDAQDALRQALLASTWQVTTLRGHSGTVYSARSSPDGKQIVTSGEDATVQIWDSVTGRTLAMLTGHQGPVHSARYSPDGRYIVTASQDQTAQIWDVATGRTVSVLRGHAGAVRDAQFSPDGKRIVTASEDRTAQIWDVATGQRLVLLSGHEGPVYSAQFSPDGRQIVTASEDRTVRLWDATTGKPWIKDPVKDPRPVVITGHEGPVYSAQFSPDGKQIVTASKDQTAQIWDVATEQQLALLTGHEGSVYSAQFSSDGKQILTASYDRTARVWNAATGQEIRRVSGHRGAVRDAQFSPDDKQIVTASEDRTAQIWNVAASPEVIVLRGHADQVSSAQYSPNRQHIVTAGYGGTVRIWDVMTGQPLVVLRGHEGPVYSAQYSRDGKQIVTAGEDRTVRIWDASTGEQLAVFAKHEGPVYSAQFSPDDKQIVTASQDQTAQILDAVTGQPLAVLNGHEGAVHGAQYSPDGKQVVTASYDRTAHIWDAATWQELAVLRGHDGRVLSAQFSSDSKRIVTASEDRTARVYLVDLTELVALAQSRVSRPPLTCEERKQYLHEDVSCSAP